MNHKPITFWEYVRALRDQGRIDRIWKPAELAKYLDGSFKANTIGVLPYNSSISMNGDKIGDYVKKGGEPKAWRVGRGLFQLVEDPDDDPETQQAQMELAKSRAKLLREEKPAMTRAELLRMMGRSNASHNSELTSTLPGRASVQSESVSASATACLPTSILVSLTKEVHQKMASLSTENKAIDIVRGYLVLKSGGRAEFEDDRQGADLRVTIDGRVERIEVKGTAASNIAWQQLKVSSQQSHDALTSGDVKIYRVVDVDSANPRIYILEHGTHFTLEPEPRWAVKRVTQQNERYPLRGMPYRYDRPHDPVALEDWEILQ